MRESHNHGLSHEPHGMIGSIKRLDFLDCSIFRGTNCKETQILRIDELSREQLVFDKGHPLIPIIAVGVLEADNRLRRTLPRLGQCQNFKSFIVRAEPTWKQRNGFGLLHKHEFSSEEVFQVNEFRVIGDDGVGTLFKGEHDVDAETLITTGPFLARLHDSISPTGDHHVAGFYHTPSKLDREEIVRVLGKRSGGSERGDFWARAVFLEHAEPMAQFLDGAIDNL